jgi:hypothetical protein
MLFCGYHFRHSCETTIKTTGGDIMKKTLYGSAEELYLWKIFPLQQQ